MLRYDGVGDQADVVVSRELIENLVHIGRISVSTYDFATTCSPSKHVMEHGCFVNEPQLAHIVLEFDICCIHSRTVFVDAMCEEIATSTVSRCLAWLNP
jgi:hypothetical protein